jgi:hypothetical protein
MILDTVLVEFHSTDHISLIENVVILTDQFFPVIRLGRSDTDPKNKKEERW